MNRLKKNTFGILALLLALLTGCSLFDRAPTYSFDVSADGRQIVFSSSGDLFLFDLESKKVTRVTNTPGDEQDPSLSPDGKMVVYAGSAPDGSTGKRIFTIDLATKKTVQLTKEPKVSDESPRFSDDGAAIYFSRNFRSVAYPRETRWTDAELMVMNPDGSSQKRLTDSRFHLISYPIVIPDKKIVLFQASAFGNGDDSGFESVFSLDLTAGAKPQDLGKVEWNSPTLEELGTGATSADSQPGDGEEAAPDVDAGTDLIAVGNMIAATDRKKAIWFKLKDFKDASNPRPIAGDRFLFLNGVGDPASSDYHQELWSVGIDGKDAKKIAGAKLFQDPMNWKPGE